MRKSVYALDGRQKRALHAALLSAFPRADALARMVEFQLDTKVAIVAGEGPLADVVFRLMEWAEAEGRTDALVNGAREENPHNLQLMAFERLVLEARDQHPQDPTLRVFAEQVQLAPALPADTDLEKRVFRAGFSNIAQWRARLGAVELAVCRIEFPAWQALGTGFLVGPDLVMTNCHVVQHLIDARDESPLLVARFDYKVSADGSRLREGEAFTPARPWLAASSPVEALDFAVLRLAQSAGVLPAGGTPSAPPRGWLTPAWRDLEQDETLFVIQHPQGDALKLASGRFTERLPTRLHYRVDTDAGSSGSPCFTAQWDLVGLHRGSAEGRANQGVPFDAIAAAAPSGLFVAPPPDARPLHLESIRNPGRQRREGERGEGKGKRGEGREEGGKGWLRMALGLKTRWLTFRVSVMVASLLLAVVVARPLLDRDRGEITMASKEPPTTAGERPVPATPPDRPKAGQGVRQRVSVDLAWTAVDGDSECLSDEQRRQVLYRGQSGGGWSDERRRAARVVRVMALERGVRLEWAQLRTAGGTTPTTVSVLQRDIVRQWAFDEAIDGPLRMAVCLSRNDGRTPQPALQVQAWREEREP